MLGKISDLMEEVRIKEEAKNNEKMKVLSMQIGPHFIYNTLNSIKWMAAVNKQPNIKKMVESLIKLMVSVTYNTNEEIYLHEEIELIKCYCYIQKVRYMNFDIVTMFIIPGWCYTQPDILTRFGMISSCLHSLPSILFFLINLVIVFKSGFSFISKETMKIHKFYVVMILLTIVIVIYQIVQMLYILLIGLG